MTTRNYVLAVGSDVEDYLFVLCHLNLEDSDLKYLTVFLIWKRMLMLTKRLSQI